GSCANVRSPLVLRQKGGSLRAQVPTNKPFMTGLNRGAETRWLMQSPEPGSGLAKIHLFSCSMAALYRFKISLRVIFSWGQIHSLGAFSQSVQGLAHCIASFLSRGCPGCVMMLMS